MIFDEFLEAISAPGLRAVAQHWNTARGSRRMPAWADIRPSAIAAQLPIIWAWRYDSSRDRFTGRIAGDAVEALFGVTIRNKELAELVEGAPYDAMFGRMKRTVSGPALYFGEGVVYRHLAKLGLGQRIILPLSDNRETCDGVFGATLYDAAGAVPLEIKPAMEERGQWFAVD